MLRSRHLPLLLVCWGLLLWGIEAASEGGADSNTTSVCYRSTLSEYETLFKDAFTLKLEESGADNSDVSIYINCMSFGQDKELETAIVSGNASTAGEQVLRFKCQGDMLFVLESEREFSTERNESCLECAGPESTAEDACLVPCAENCDRCYGTSDTCDCTRRVYNTTEVKCEVEELTEEELGEHEEYVDMAIETVIEGHSHCASECPEHYHISEDGHGDPSICYLCGVRFCAECHMEEGECTECLPHTKLFHEGEGECLFGVLAEILQVSEEQEREVEKEEADKERSRITLAVTLPIVSVVVVAAFIFMSFLAHKRYPHIGETGKTRHRSKPPPVAETEYAVGDSVFRPRPTVRLR